MYSRNYKSHDYAIISQNALQNEVIHSDHSGLVWHLEILYEAYGHIRTRLLSIVNVEGNTASYA